MKKVLTAATVTASLLATFAVAPAAQAGFDRAAAKRVMALVGVHSHRHKAHKGHHKHARHTIYGYPNNCAQMQRRADLTGNAYWRYAAHRCRTDRYISH